MRRHRFRFALGVATVTLALVGASCSPADDAGEVTSTGAAPAPPPTDAAPTTQESAKEPATPRATAASVAAFRDLLDEDGNLPIDVALRIFARDVSPLPGIEPLPAELELPHVAAESATRSLTGARATLDADVAAAIDAFIAPRADDIAVDLDNTRARTVSGAIGVDGTEPTPDELAAAVADIVADFEARTGHALRLSIRVRLIAGDTSLASPHGSGSRPSSCLIQFSRPAFSAGVQVATSILAHEVWHCFQADANRAAWSSDPQWIAEGQAEWAGESYVGGSENSFEWWWTWLSEPHASLWARSYDGLGIYAVAAQEGADPWRTMLPMLGQANLAAVSTLFGGPGAEQSALATAQHLVRAPDVGAPWESTGPGIIDAMGADVLAPTFASPAEVSRAVGRFATLPVVLAIPAADDVITITVIGGVGGAVQLQGTETLRLAPGGSARWCLRTDGCLCPNGSDPPGGQVPIAQPGEGAAAVGAVDAAELGVRAEFSSLDQECEGGLVGVWVSDVNTQLATLLRAIGGESAPGCGGPYTLVFAPDGTFSVDFALDCTTPDGSAEGTVSFGGGYVDRGDTFSLSNIQGDGVLTVRFADIEQSIDVLDGFRQSGSAPLPYTIDGDVLTYVFAGEPFSFTAAG